MAIFGDQITKLVVQRQAVQICQQVRDGLAAAAAFQSWLSALADADLTTLGFAASDISYLRGAFADLLALNSIFSNAMPGGAYPAPTTVFDYRLNVKQIIGPQ